MGVNRFHYNLSELPNSTPREKTREIEIPQSVGSSFKHRAKPLNNARCKRCDRKVDHDEPKCWNCGEEWPGVVEEKKPVCVHCKKETHSLFVGCDHCGRDPRG